MKQYLLYILIALFAFPMAVRGKYTPHHISATEISSTSINSFSIQPITDKTYTGIAIEPLVVVSDAADAILTNNVDYTVAYNQNINAGTAYVTITGIGDYEGTLTSTFVISKARLTITARPQTMVYGTTPSSLNLEGEYDITGFVNNETQSVLHTLPTVYIDSSITSASTVGTYNNIVRASGATAGNYTMSYTHNHLTITQNKGSGYLTFDPIGDKTYGDKPFRLNGNHSLGKAVTFESCNPDIVSITGSGSNWVATIHNAGDVTITMKFAGDANLIAEETEQIITIAKAQLYVTALPQERGYGEGNANISSNYCMSGFVNASDAGGFTCFPTAYISPEYGADIQPGTYIGGVLVSGGEHPNYVTNYSYGTLTIEPIIRNIHFAPFCGKTYGDPSFNLSATHAGGLPVKFESLNPNIISVQEVDGIWTATILHAGTAVIRAYVEGDEGHGMTEKFQSINIARTPLTIYTANKSRYYGQPNPEFTLSFSGLKYDDSVNDFGTIDITCPATERSNVGQYTIYASGAVNPNYIISYSNGNLSVNQATLSVKAKEVETIFGTPPSSLNLSGAYEISGFLFDDNETVLTSKPTVEIDASITEATSAGTYERKVLVSGAVAQNYAAIYTSNTLTIRKAQQIITFPEPGTKLLEDEPFNAQASIDTRLPLTYSSGNQSIAEIVADGTITILKTGTVTITVTQEGNENYEPATVSHILNITSDDATIHRLTINGQAINIEDNMHYDLLCREVTDYRVIIETETNAIVSTGKLFTAVVDKPMLKVIELKVTSQDGTKTKTYTLTIEKRFNFDAIVITRWNNTMTVINNPENNGGYRFTSFKWFRNGEELATGQSYSAGSKGETLLGTDRYFVEVTSNNFDGTLRSCEGYPNLKSMTVKAYPNPAGLNETIYVEADVADGLLDGAVIEIYNITGVKIKQVKVQGHLTPINIDKGSLGTYIFKLKGKDGFSREVKIVVN